MNKFWVLSLFIFGNFELLAQCNAIVQDTFVCHYGDEIIITPEVSGFSITDTYIIEEIVYQFYLLSDSANEVFLFDDDVTDAIPIGFDFDFFGETYSDFYIGSNGWISFSPNQSTEYFPREIPSSLNTPLNSIMAPWEDWDPSIQGNVSYEVIGPLNAQKLIISYNSIGHYNCGANSGALGSFQIVLNQEDFSIETHIQQKASCDTIKAVHGIQNQDGSIAYVVDDRNANSWSAYFESVKFQPSNITNYSWSNSSSQLSIAEELIISPNVSNTYFLTLSDQLNCIIELDFNIEVLVALDPLLTRVGQFLHSDIESSEYNYQWYLNNVPLEGENNPYIELFEFGEYNIEISNPETNCQYFSRTHLYTQLSVLEELKEKLIIFPNPTTEGFFISIFSNEMLFFKLYNIQGELINSDQFYSSYYCHLESLSPGVYFVDISDKSSYSIIEKIVVK